MKSYHVLPLILFFLSVLITSCDEKEDDNFVIWDFDALEISFDVQNDKGESLLLPGNEGNIIDTDAINLIYEGKEYTPLWTDEDKYNSISRYNLTHFFGLYYETHTNTVPVLKVGEFDRARDLDETFTILHNGKSDTFRVVNTVTWKKHKPQIRTTIYLNDQKVKGIPVIKY